MKKVESSVSFGHQKLGEILVQGGVVGPEQLRAALGHQRRWGGRLGEILVGMGFADEQRISKALSKQLGVPEVDPSALEIPQHVLAKVPLELCQRHRLIPFALRRDERGETFLHVAMADPSDLAAMDDLRFTTGVDIRVAVASEIDITTAIRRHHGSALEMRSPFDEQGRAHESTGELLRFGEEPLQLEDEGEAAALERTARLPLGGEVAQAPSRDQALRDLYSESDPAFRAVEALVRILARKGILLEDEFLQEILKEFDGKA